MTPLKIAGIGCGERTWIYMQLISERPEQFQILAAADPVPEYRERLEQLSNTPEFRSFDDAKSFFTAGKIADLVIIGTQDRYHFAPCKKALELGYDIVLEKPIAPDLNEVLELEQRARELGRKVMVCHIYRFNPLFNQVKDLLSSGTIGDLISMNATEGVEPWHFAHSFVRGHWAKEAQSNPIIMAKTCHDLDLISWMVDSPVTSVSSFGELLHFTPPEQPDPQPNALCPSLTSGEITTPYCALRYLHDKKFPWLAQIFPRAHTATDQEILDWLKQSPWGRSVYHCDNDVMDHQTVNLRFENGVIVNLTMTAFETGRFWEIHGTTGTLKLHFIHDDNPSLEIVIKKHHTNEITRIPIDEPPGGYRFHHEGGDVGIIDALYHEMTLPHNHLKSSITNSLQSHLMAFAAEISRKQARVVQIKELITPPNKQCLKLKA
ncbi:Gfo/Idh/MocA family protein [Rubritalea tangerina]|uniref:Gfo/Idh/MocA family protein n=1 Tax=Rubritalea tangerina TaxID=430798 RepID=A0ABW4Z8A5_9BACT